LENKIFLALLFVTFLSSLESFRLDKLHCKVIALVLAIDCIVEAWAWFLTMAKQNNMPLYNFNSLQEFLLYAYYYYLIIDNTKVRKMIRVYLWVLPFAWIILVMLVFRPNKWSSHFFLVGCVPMVLLSAYYYYQLFTAEKLVRLSASFEFWVATALIIYYACNLPYLGMLNFLNKNYLDLANKLLIVTHITNFIFYIILFYAFTWATPIEKSS
jgi:hypothetical protein